MEKITSFDKQGRVYIPEKVRKALDSKTFVLKFQDKKILIEPVEEDPIEALGKLGKEKLKGKSIKKLKEEARKEIKENA